MGRRLANYHKKLIGKYEGLTEQQAEYIRIETDPETRIRKLTQQDIADSIGVSRVTVNKWHASPKIRKIIIAETSMKTTDKYGDILNVIEGIIFDDKAKNIEKLKAVELWGKFHGTTEEAKQSVTEKKQKGNKTYEDILREAEKALGDDVEDADDGSIDEEPEEFYTGITVDKD